jgi:hypothetical protein
MLPSVFIVRRWFVIGRYWCYQWRGERNSWIVCNFRYENKQCLVLIDDSLCVSFLFYFLYFYVITWRLLQFLVHWSLYQSFADFFQASVSPLGGNVNSSGPWCFRRQCRHWEGMLTVLALDVSANWATSRSTNNAGRPGGDCDYSGPT